MMKIKMREKEVLKGQSFKTMVLFKNFINLAWIVHRMIKSSKVIKPSYQVQKEKAREEREKYGIVFSSNVECHK